MFPQYRICMFHTQRNVLFSTSRRQLIQTLNFYRSLIMSVKSRPPFISFLIHVIYSSSFSIFAGIGLEPFPWKSLVWCFRPKYCIFRSNVLWSCDWNWKLKPGHSITSVRYCTSLLSIRLHREMKNQSRIFRGWLFRLPAAIFSLVSQLTYCYTSRKTAFHSFLTEIPKYTCLQHVAKMQLSAHDQCAAREKKIEEILNSNNAVALSDVEGRWCVQ